MCLSYACCAPDSRTFSCEDKIFVLLSKISRVQFSYENMEYLFTSVETFDYYPEKCLKNYIMPVVLFSSTIFLKEWSLYWPSALWLKVSSLCQNFHTLSQMLRPVNHKRVQDWILSALYRRKKAIFVMSQGDKPQSC